MLNTFFVLFCVLLLFCATMSLQSRSAILALSMSLIFYFFIKSSKKNKLFILLTVGWFIFVFGPFIWNKLISIRASTYYGRINAFSDAICLISDRFWGVGWGGFRELTNMGTVLHNSFLAAFVSGGHIAGITFLLIILYPFYSLLKYRNNNRFLINGFLSGYLANIFLLLSYNGITEYQYFIYPVIACKILEQIKNTPKITIHSH